MGLRDGCCGEEKTSCLCWESNQDLLVLQSVVLSLYRLSYPRSLIKLHLKHIEAYFSIVFGVYAVI
jgi:hypothetical protein